MLDGVLKFLPANASLRLSGEWFPGGAIYHYEASLRLDGVEVAGAVAATEEDLLVAVEQLIRARFDPTYDECEWRPR